ncbi:MAG: hypothetical protein COU85_00725 [Candidatus Portnoybacteria bacterium CG10_big_fil_rev_8_21_14_0_10_44_7]|uniref:Uncharacterized protein n=1 Tax=Candidatus Portnoybacteria bacterium CG10_big_fil_rev_8_21_14_0_10_44_7 TaxID=1974816 RepID=A0A2M8KJ88_9BACT|nr:MAG: hypothetical protein COU85_00725 [Candidatus Portnoybacteria bacterium CG10_big_fil_rev_8_21_14_0_10_44_7]
MFVNSAIFLLPVNFYFLVFKGRWRPVGRSAPMHFFTSITFHLSLYFNKIFVFKHALKNVL